ncbi:MAG: hypothetical protein OES47_00085 [Acidobacteriota bacterium]|nr:hypothetical protein [Acidobacteriota bacterium]
MELIVRRRGEEEHIRLERRGSGFLVRVADRSYEVDCTETSASARSLLVGACQHDVSVRHLGDGEYEVDTGTGLERIQVLGRLEHLAETAHGAKATLGAVRVTAYMPGRVIALLAEEGARVQAGDGVLVLEAMKMENEIRADRSGVIKRFLVDVGQPVEGGEPLYEFE